MLLTSYLSFKMGLLTQGDKLLSWEETRKQSDLVRRVGVQQFIAAYHRERARKGDPFKWGDEVEFILATLNSSEQRAQLSLTGPNILPVLLQAEKDDPHYPTSWTPEYARYMIEEQLSSQHREVFATFLGFRKPVQKECAILHMSNQHPGTPAGPYGDSLSEVTKVEENMKIRRQQLYDILKGTGVFPLTLSVFPRLGCPKFTSPEYEPSPQSSVMKSVFYPDEVVVQPEEHPRFMAVTDSVHQRRRDKHAINVPIFEDKRTPTPFLEEFPKGHNIPPDTALPDHVYMDCLGFGPGCSCVQVTVQAPDVEQCRYLHDQLAVIGPLLLVLTAGSPIYRGYLANVDCRWDVIAAAVDDRTPGERGIEPPRSDELFIPKSRWATAECFIASDLYNDIYVPNDPALFQQLKDAGVDDLLAKHIAYLFIRDPLMLYESSLEQDPSNDANHYENLLTSNWQSMRFKLPKPEINAGWRVEVRTMDHQLTDSQNSAFAVFVMLLARMILSLKPNLYVPMSKVEENMRRVQKLDAVRREKFYCCKNPFPERQPTGGPSAHYTECELMDANTIFNGKGDFPGLVPLVRRYVDNADADDVSRAYILKVLQFVSMRASGELKTTARWIRDFVTSHPDYKQDSAVSDKITYDLISKIKEVAEGTTSCPDLAGPLDSA